jgi:hypothetical protein
VARNFMVGLVGLVLGSLSRLIRQQKGIVWAKNITDDKKHIKYLIHIHTHRQSLVSKIETKKKQRAEAPCLVTTCITC